MSYCLRAVSLMLIAIVTLSSLSGCDLFRNMFTPDDIDTNLPTSAFGKLRYLGPGSDRVGTYDPNPNGEGDVHFFLVMNLTGVKTVTSIKLGSSDSDGNFDNIHHWNTIPSASWILGVFRDTIRLNPNYEENLSDTISEAADYNLYGNGQDIPKRGMYFTSVVTFEGGDEFRATTQIE